MCSVSFSNSSEWEPPRSKPSNSSVSKLTAGSPSVYRGSTALAGREFSKEEHFFVVSREAVLEAEHLFVVIEF